MTTETADEAMRAALRELRDAYIGSVACDYPVCIGGECDHECERDEKSVEVSRDPLIAALRALDACGWVLVPKVATHEMRRAFAVSQSGIGRSPFTGAYDAMLAAAPKLTGASDE